MTRKQDDFRHSTPLRGLSQASAAKFPTCDKQIRFRAAPCTRTGHTRSNYIVFSVAYRGAFSCMEYRCGGAPRILKPTDQMTGAPTNWSVRFFRTLLQLFGRRIQPPTSPPWWGAVCAPPKDISEVNENGPATRSPPSSRKSFDVTRCEISKSPSEVSRCG